MNILFNKILFMAVMDIFLTGVDFVDAYEVGYFEEWYDEIDDEIDENYTNNINSDDGSPMIKCPFCKNRKKEKIYQQDRDLIGVCDYGRIFKCLECKKIFYLSNEIVRDEEIMSFKRY